MSHQSEGITFLTEGRHGLLAFEQGLGKTLVAIEAFRRLKEGGNASQMLVICPNSLKRNWLAEIAKFAPSLIAIIAEGPPKTRRSILARPAADVIVTSYETARSEVTAILALTSLTKTVLVLDESHAAKNQSSLTSTAMRHIAPRCAFRWLLSGTPVTNTPADLFTQIEIAACAKPLGSLETFLARLQEDGTANFAKPAIDQFVLRRTKDECLDLPEKIHSDVIVELPNWQRQLYDDMRTQMVCNIQSMNGAEYQIFCYPSNIPHSLSGIRENYVARRSTPHVVIEFAAGTIAFGFGRPKVLPVNLLTDCLIVIYPPKLRHL